MKPLGYIKSSPLREIYRSKCLHWKSRKNKNEWLNDAAQKFGKTRENKTQTTRQQEIINIRVQISEIETKKAIPRLNEFKSWFFEKINKIDRQLSQLIKRKREDPK